MVGQAVAGPALGGDGERLLSGLLGEVEVAEEADQRREDPAPRVAEDLVDRRSQSRETRSSGYHSTGRTSMAPP